LEKILSTATVPNTIQYNKNVCSAYSLRVSRALKRRLKVNNVQKEYVLIMW